MKVEETSFNLRPGLLVTKDNYKFFITNEIGGRILWYGTEDYNILHEGDEELFIKKFDYSYIKSTEGVKQKRISQGWLDLGGYKTWLAPQTKWQGPPYIELDSATYLMEYYYKSNGDVFIKQTSPICRETNIVLDREITINQDFDVIINHKITKLDDTIVSWGIWDVTQVKKSCNVYVKHARVLKYEVFGEESDLDDFIEYCEDKGAMAIHAPKGEDRGFKVYLLSESNKILTEFENGIEYIKEFDTNVKVRYAHDSNVEVYSDFNKNYAEIEAHSPLFNFNKENRTYSFKIVWKINLPKKEV